MSRRGAEKNFHYFAQRLRIFEVHWSVAKINLSRKNFFFLNVKNIIVKNF